MDSKISMDIKKYIEALTQEERMELFNVLIDYLPKGIRLNTSLILPIEELEKDN